MRKTDLAQKELIYNLYFKNKLTLTEISNEISLSISQISRILHRNPLYKQEKDKRKEENYIKHNEQAKQIMKKKRNTKQLEEKQVMDMLHNQASIELSYTYPISKAAIRKNCSNAYEYNLKKKRFELKNDMVYSNDMPKIIKY